MPGTIYLPHSTHPPTESSSPRAEGLVNALRHENASLRARLKMLDEIGLNPSHTDNAIDTPTTKEKKNTMQSRRVSMLLKKRDDPRSTSVDTPPTQRGDYVAKKMFKLQPKQIMGGRTGRSARTTATGPQDKPQQQQQPSNSTTQQRHSTTEKTHSFLDVIASDLPRVAKPKSYVSTTMLKTAASTRLPLGTIAPNNATEVVGDVQSVQSVQSTVEF